MNPFLICLFAMIAVVVLVWASNKYTKYIDNGNENDDDLDLFH